MKSGNSAKEKRLRDRGRTAEERGEKRERERERKKRERVRRKGEEGKMERNRATTVW